MFSLFFFFSSFENSSLLTTYSKLEMFGGNILFLWSQMLLNFHFLSENLLSSADINRIFQLLSIKLYFSNAFFFSLNITFWSFSLEITERVCKHTGQGGGTGIGTFRTEQPSKTIFIVFSER